MFEFLIAFSGSGKYTILRRNKNNLCRLIFLHLHKNTWKNNAMLLSGEILLKLINSYCMLRY